MNDCQSIRTLISATLDARRASPALEVAQHLAGCAGCRAFHNELTALDMRLSRTVPPGAAGGDMPAGMHERIMAAVDAAGSAKVVPFWRRPVAVLLGAAAAMAVAALVMWDRGGEDPAAAITTVPSPTPENAAGGGLPSGFQVPIDFPGLVAAAGGRLPGAFGPEADAIVADFGKLRDFLGSRFQAVARGGS